MAVKRARALKIQNELQDITRTQSHLRNRELHKRRSEQCSEDASFLKEYLRVTVAGVLREGLRNLRIKQPADFVDFLADYLFENSDMPSESQKEVDRLIREAKANK